MDQACCAPASFFISILLQQIDKKRVDESESLTLDSTRQSLIRQEGDIIIICLWERAQYAHNPSTYEDDATPVYKIKPNLVAAV